MTNSLNELFLHNIDYENTFVLSQPIIFQVIKGQGKLLSREEHFKGQKCED